jgi:hypothetical protein
MLTLREVSFGMYGAWRLALLDRGAMLWFDRSVQGVWRSFWAAALAYPGFLILLLLRLDPQQVQAAGLAHILLVETIGYVVGWAAYPVLAIPFCRWLAPEEQALGFIIAYNWSQVLQTALLVVIAGLGAVHLMAADSVTALAAVAYLLLLVYEWFIARIALAAGGAAATALVLLDVVLGAMLIQVTQSLY